MSATRRGPSKPAPGVVVPADVPLTADGRIFRRAGEPWRWKGVSAFQLLDRFARGEDIQPFLDAYRGFNLLRVWPYVAWEGTGWDSPTIIAAIKFLQVCRGAGFYVEWTLLTDDRPERLPEADRWVRFFASQAQAGANLSNLLLEIGNEPTTHKNINTPALRAACDASGFLYASGDYEDSHRFFGSFLTAHTPRDDEWPRKAHDLMEFYGGGGPSAPSDPAHKVPVVADEPIRPDQARGNREQDFLAYYGTCSLLGAGATFHCETGKYARVPTDDEARLAAIALQAMNAFPADAPNGAYRRPVENSLRTYAVGPYMVRVRPTTPDAPESGWKSLDAAGILWTR